MSEHADGGAAFPRIVPVQAFPAGGRLAYSPGLSTRMYIAIKAMQTLLADKTGGVPIEEKCLVAFRIADKMIEASKL